MKYILEVSTLPKRLSSYVKITPKTVERIMTLSREFQGMHIVHINAAAAGGGVAEMLSGVVPLQRDAGLDSKWYVINPDSVFFTITKKIHNFLQGKSGGLMPEEMEYYLEYNRSIARDISRLNTDVLVVHDPQPMASIAFIDRKPDMCIWRSHIDMTTPNEEVLRFLLPYINLYDHFVFSMNEFVPSELNADRVDILTPAIDPLSEKNIKMSRKKALSIMRSVGVDVERPVITQISRLDPWKDPIGVIDAYRLAKKQVPDLQLVLIGNTATDDPEGAGMFNKVKWHIQNENDIHLLLNMQKNDLVVNAFQTGSTVIIQKSLREGFGLTVTEALWKNAVVIAGNVGGIKMQIQDGVNGFLTKSVKNTAEKIVDIIRHPDKARDISHVANKSVKDRFLLTHDLLRWLELFKRIRTMNNISPVI